MMERGFYNNTTTTTTTNNNNKIDNDKINYTTTATYIYNVKIYAVIANLGERHS